jgi:hypothetical protein
MENLTKKNYLSYAMKVYDNPSCAGLGEFQSDLLRVKYVKRLINRYSRTGDIAPRLLLNHIIGIYNVFEATSVAHLLFFRTDKKSWSALKTVLDYLNLMPETLLPIEGVIILNKDIPRDEVLWAKLNDTVEGHATTR